MKEFHFSKKYFNKLIYDDIESNIRIIIKEIPSLDVYEEDYSLRVETHHEERKLIHRKYAIEHHSRQDKHNYPHLQFKFHTEEIGTFWLRLEFETQDEYKKAILGFIYKIKNILEDLERFKPGICDDILVLTLVKNLSKEGEFLTQKISESIAKHELEFQNYGNTRDKVKSLHNNPLLINFLGEDNVTKVAASYGKAYSKKKNNH
ncbi:MAG: hypothetical protein KKB39_03690 [Nanoarchaeota archaeon]|nr:hypothetical protein [Nanoarchaeota archaeon]